ncbi:hydroxyisourate hydrolase [Actinophytocola sp.]|uniref:hydroxyisourate hydrolase n=1 Tax=Actinophytocola sp. TaxID=1872138 RepID=UPI002D7EF909|nr:hydroxyisourate hydrolase [Actinophytocola sp.]HET9140198.1 hydroxyisourate hydrolase [Actinophytocola sp.]
MTLSTHVLDTSRGRPAAAVPIRLEREEDDGWRHLAQGHTNLEGRLSGLAADRPGVYRLIFGTRDYFGPDAFYPEVTVAFRIADPKEHYHVPLLISPFGYSTYRGS